MDMPSKRPIPPNRWVFTGSRVIKEGFEADLAKSLVAVYPRSRRHPRQPLAGRGDQRAISSTPKRVPKRGTPVDFVIKAFRTDPPLLFRAAK